MFTLIVYISIGYSQFATGGPVNMGNYPSKVECEEAGKSVVQQIKKADTFWCVKL